MRFTVLSRIVGAACALLVLSPSVLRAEVSLPEVFGSNMVLQREVPVPVWGWADPGEEVSVSIGDQTKTATTGADGKWALKLDALKPGGPFTVSVKGKSSTLQLENVLVGDVWICSGQSNMEFRMHAFKDTAEDIAASSNPNIRLFQPKLQWSATPREHFAEGAAAKWKLCEPLEVKDFSATAYYFGRRLNAELNVPIGLINSSWGGTRIEPWVAPSGFRAVSTLPAFVEDLDAKDPTSAFHKKLVGETLTAYKNWLQTAEKAFAETRPVPVAPAFPGRLTPFSSHQQPTTLYNAMIYPYVPLAVKGAIWYQGESNLTDGAIYAEKMKALIAGWRDVFAQPELPFYFVQLAPYNYGNDPEALAKIWEAQAAVEKEVPHTGMAVINDIGNLKDIHPLHKDQVGARLANLALNRTYGKKDIACDFPTYQSFTVEGDTLIVRFAGAKSLKTRDGKAPDWFEIAGLDGSFKKADAVIDGATVRLTAPELDAPLIVRFAWNMLAEPNLQNEAGLPASAFRAGELPERALLDARVPDAKNFKLLYALDPTKPQLVASGTDIAYRTDNSDDLTGKVKRVGYFLYLKPKTGEEQYVFVTMPPLAQNLKQLGFPTKKSGARFQCEVADVTVASNVPGVATGTFASGCSVEFWDCNYGPKNELGIPEASDTLYDFGDEINPGASPGYGSMQVHNVAKKQTIFAFNGQLRGEACDLGIGNCPKGPNPDWTFSASAQTYAAGVLQIYVEME